MINSKFVFATISFTGKEDSDVKHAMKARPFMADTIPEVINDVLSFAMTEVKSDKQIDMIFVNDVSKRMDGHVF